MEPEGDIDLLMLQAMEHNGEKRKINSGLPKFSNKPPSC